ncbi:DUF3293 domain-containing protein [Polaromonas sp.]|uniref:DUF3293 domain-containing protein n=1 Tax=Polaromonas sp. TaxID=1869339 RepID=UPI0027302A21|nr:DUF3293 domain-containing protein [Polaromonas sp.]MDP1740968.1 DUF3293 domain-containing protein [Polaromonas sp.]
MSIAEAIQSQPPNERPVMPAQGLVDAYRLTDFVVQKTDDPIVLQVDHPVRKLKHWLEAQKSASAVVISAWNPFSMSLSMEENTRRNQELGRAIEIAGLRSVSASGCARSGNWEPEASFCVFDVPLTLVNEWMQRFEQYAVVRADKNGTCRLLWHPAIRTAMSARETP